MRSLCARLVGAALVLQAATLAAYCAVVDIDQRGQFVVFAALLLLSSMLAMYLIVSRLTRNVGRVAAEALGVAQDRFALDGARVRTAEQSLRESEQRFALVAAGSNDGIWDWDFARDTHYLSPRLKTMLGYSDTELPSRRDAYRQCIHPDDREGVFAAVERCFREGGEYEDEYRLCRKSGGHVWVRSRGATVRATDGSIARFCGSISEISTQREAAERLNALLDEQRAMLDNLVAGIVRLKDRRIVTCNRRFAEMYGYSVEELVGQSTALLDPDGAHDAAGETVYDDLARDGKVGREFRHRRRDGSLIWVYSSGTALDRDHPRRDSLWIDVDISEQKRAEQALRENEARFYHAVRGSRDAIWDWDLANDRYYMSPRMKEILGYGFGEAIRDRSWFLEHLHEDDRARVDAARLAHFENGAPYDVDYRMRAADGTIRWIRARGESVRDANGRVVRYSGANSDISEQLRHGEEVRALNQQLEQRVAERTGELTRANRELESFSYTVSHDLSAPLRAINGFSALLVEELGGKLEPSAQGLLERIVAGSMQMKALIDDLLRLAQISRTPLVAREVDLAVLARRIAGECANDPVRTAAGRSVEFRAPEALPAHGDAGLLGIALTNLIGNAWKFTGRSGSALVEFGAIERAGERVYFLRDNGAGLDMRYADKLFKPFQRLHSAREFDGTGIGLAIVHRIFERHHGRVWVESAPGAGCTFYFTLGPTTIPSGAHAA